MNKVAILKDILKDKDNFAKSLINLYDKWRIQRDNWIEEKKELRNYIFATDTSTLSKSSLP